MECMVDIRIINLFCWIPVLLDPYQMYYKFVEFFVFFCRKSLSADSRHSCDPLLADMFLYSYGKETVSISVQSHLKVYR